MLKKAWWILAVGIIIALSPWARAPLTFEDRVKAQEAIERVYYNHRIWPKENPQPKPPFEQMVPRSVIDAKVTDYLKKCAALDKYWQRPIQPEQLQAEMDRMARKSKDPATLKELLAALRNDPTLIAECLARPVLADRLIHSWYANDTRFHAEAKRKSERALDEASPGALSAWPDGEFRTVTYRVQDPRKASRPPPPKLNELWLEKDEFQKITTQSQELGRLSIRESGEAFLVERTALLSERALVLEIRAFRKRSFESWYEEIGPALPACASSSGDRVFRMPAMSRPAESGPSAGAWLDSSLVQPDAPEPRYWHCAVWTGTEMIVWGGPSNRGGRYNPLTDTWAGTSTGPNCPTGLYLPSAAVWTGTEMIVWGGLLFGAPLGSGGRYDPASDTWRPTSRGGGCPSARHQHTAVWTGTQMIVWGGYDGALLLNSGGRYTPSSDTWTATSTGANCPEGRESHTSVWTGREMIVWGGALTSSILDSGGRYDPSTDRWTATSHGTGCPSARCLHTAVWTGSEMIIWGGRGLADTYFDTATGARYNPSTDAWTATSTGTGCPQLRESHAAVWTGTEMIIWGGGDYIDALGPSNSGGRYTPSSDSWTATSTGTNCPSVREGFTAIWTGEEMIVWGGRDFDNYSYLALNSGSRYRPSTDSWVPTSTQPFCPSARGEHTAVWTGNEMIVWGAAEENSGGRYVPATDNWTATSTGSGCPSARYDHTAVWTGSGMIIWGGWDLNSPFNSGGSYEPASDTWTATSTESACPAPRGGHIAAWTGTEMIVWGGVTWPGTSTYFNTGGRYDPSTDAWTPTSTGPNCPEPRVHHTGVWTGAEMIVWGGENMDSIFNSGGRYDPISDAWMTISTGSGCPEGRRMHTAVWTGEEMTVWGGWGEYYDLNSGSRYNPVTDSWAETSTLTGCPAIRYYHTAVWTGSEMIVWGGFGGETPPYVSNTGGRYDPATDTWAATSTGPKCPSARFAQSAVWTGTHMIVWGGYAIGGFGYLPTSNSGGLYSPSGPCPAITPSPALLPDGIIGTPYSQVFGADGGSGPYAYSLVGGSLPPGLDLSSSGVVSGVPTEHGAFIFTVMAMDMDGCAGSVPCSLTTAGLPPVIASLSQAGSPFRIIVKGTNLKQGVQVSINYMTWYGTAWKNDGKIVIKGGAYLKSVMPKGVDTIFTFLNPDGGQAILTWHW